MKVLLLVVASLFAGSAWDRLGPFGDWRKITGGTYQVEGTVMGTSIHTCNFKYDDGLPGYCNGALRIQSMYDGKIVRQEIVVTAKVAIELDGRSPVTLDSLKPGMPVRVVYTCPDGLFIASSISATSSKPSSK